MAMKRVAHTDVLRVLGTPDRRAILDLARDLHGGAAQLVAAVRDILATIDQDALFAAEKARYAWDVWDGESPINGVPADVVRQRHNMGEKDGAYWIARDGQVFIFQPVKGVIDAATLRAQAEAHVDEIVGQVVAAMVTEQVETALLGG